MKVALNGRTNQMSNNTMTPAAKVGAIDATIISIKKYKLKPNPRLPSGINSVTNVFMGDQDELLKNEYSK